MPDLPKWEMDAQFFQPPHLVRGIENRMQFRYGQVHDLYHLYGGGEPEEF